MQAQLDRIDTRNVAGTETDTVRIVRDEKGFAALEADWRALEAALPDAPYFASYDWCLSWWNWFGRGSGRRMAIVAIHRGGVLQALLPLTIVRLGPFASARLMGDETGQYADCLVRPERRGDAALAGAVAAGLKTLRIDRVTLTNCRDDAAVTELLEPARRGHAWITAAEMHNVEVRPADFGSLEAYMKSRSSSMRKGLRRRRRKLAELGNVRHECIKDAGELAQVAERILALKLEWLKENGLHGRFLAKPGVAGWMAELMGRALAAGRLHMSVIRCDRRICAAQLAFRSQSKLTGYFSAFDTSLASYAVGKLHLEEHIKEIFNKNIVLDLMPPSDTYKCEWGVEAMRTSAYTVPLTTLGALVSRVYSVRTRALAKRLYLDLPSFMRAGVAAALLELLRRLRRRLTGARPAAPASASLPPMANLKRTES